MLAPHQLRYGTARCQLLPRQCLLLAQTFDCLAPLPHGFGVCPDRTLLRGLDSQRRSKGVCGTCRHAAGWLWQLDPRGCELGRLHRALELAHFRLRGHAARFAAADSHRHHQQMQMRCLFVKVQEIRGQLIRLLPLGPSHRRSGPSLHLVRFKHAGDVLLPWPEVTSACTEHDLAAQH